MKNEFVVYLTTYSGDKLPKYYIGSTSKMKVESGKYFGTVVSKRYKKIFERELKDNHNLFSIQILSYHKTRKEALEEELRIQKDNNVVKSNEYFNESYASINGCFGRNVLGSNNPMFNRKNEVIAIDENGNRIRVSKEEFDKNTKLSGHTSGQISVIEIESGLLVRINVEDYHKNKSKYKHYCVGMIVNNETKKILSNQRIGSLVVRDWEGNKFKVNKNDERIKSGTLGYHRALRYIVTDLNGNEYKTMNIVNFFKNYNISFYKCFKQINGDVIVNHNPANGNSLNGWRIKCLDLQNKRSYKRNKN
jgi:hypothetical protein